MCLRGVPGTGMTISVHRGAVGQVRRDADEIFHEFTRSVCPVCLRGVDAQVLLRASRVYLRKRCPEHGWFEGLISSDAEAYVASARFNKPGSIPLAWSTEVRDGCPWDCGLCPEHKQHICVALIEVNSGCNLDCPVCFANAGQGFNLTLPEVERMLDRLVELEGNPEVVQFSGGEPTIHPQILDFVVAAQARGIPHVMINTNGVRIAADDAFLEALAELRPSIYLQFDGLQVKTHLALRGQDLRETKARALDRLSAAGLDVVLVAAMERNVNDDELGDLVRFGLGHPAVRGIAFQPVTHVGRHPDFDPLQRMTIPDVIGGIVAQSDGMLRNDDFVPVPCCFPTCQSNTYLYLSDEGVVPLPRVLNVDENLDYITNRAVPDLAPLNPDVRQALEALWSSAAVPGTAALLGRFRCAGDECLTLGWSDLALKQRLFQISIKDFMDAWTFNVKQVMKCCVGVLVPDGRLIPFCAYNTVGYREQVRDQLRRRKPPLPLRVLAGGSSRSANAERASACCEAPTGPIQTRRHRPRNGAS
jgi:7,8-dihydro-6-hydroxymethylpterin dimethyltransferase